MQIGLGIGTTFRRKWVPPLTEQIRSLLFGSGQQGAMYDPSNLNTLFQDAAGTVPVTAMEQPVGRILDISGNNNHAFQATTTKRPAYSRRVNLLANTETPDSFLYGAGATVSGGFSSLQENTGTGLHGLQPPASVVEGVGYVISCRAKRGEGARNLTINIAGGAPGAIFDFDSGVSVVSGAAISKSSKMVLQPDGDFYCELRFESAFTYATDVRFLMGRKESGSANDSYAGDGTSSVLIKQIDFRLATDAHLPYQWVNTATDYDADPAKFPSYLRFDGVDDALQTGNIDFTGTDKMTVWAGVTKLSDAIDQARIAELGANSAVTPGTFGMLASPALEAGYRAQLFGTSRAVRDSLYAYLAPVSNTVTMQLDIAGAVASDEIRARVNGAYSEQTILGPAGTGNFGNLPINIGSANGSSNYFNGRLYPLIVRGAQSSLSQIETGELYIKQKMRMP